MSYWYILILLSILLQINTKPIDPSKIVIALNCGSKTQVVNSADNSFKYQPDANFVSGNSVDVDYNTNAQASNSQIKYSFERELYMFERHTYSSMKYSLPVKPGKNTLIIKFAEMYFKEVGKRVFNIKIGSKIVVQDLDIIQKAGSRFAAHQQYIEFQARKDGIYIDQHRVHQAYEGGKLQISFEKGVADNPIVNGIIVYHSAIENSPQTQYQNMRKSWQNQLQMRKAKKEQKNLQELISIQKKKQKITIRNDQLVLEDQNDNNPGASQVKTRFGLIRSLLMSPIGIIIWTALFVFQFAFLYNKFFKLGQSSEKKGQPRKKQ